jgi:hypothetical protein
MGALAAHRQIFTVAQTAVRTYVEMALDIPRDFPPEIAFDFVSLVEDLADLNDIVVGKGVALEIEGHSRLAQDFSRAPAPDPKNVGQRDFHPLAFRQIHACDTCHTVAPLKFEIPFVAAHRLKQIVPAANLAAVYA